MNDDEFFEMLEWWDAFVIPLKRKDKPDATGESGK